MDNSAIQTALKRRVSALHGLVNDRFLSLIHFCLNLPFGGQKLAVQMLKELAILHSKKSLETDLFKELYAPLPENLSPQEALQYVFDIHIKEKVINNEWARIEKWQAPFFKY